ncbi:MAG: IS256 family transposase [Planctomycetota bacterium]
MTHHSSEPTNLSLALELLNEHGFDSMANVLQILFNEAMKIERTKYLGASPYERSDDRRAQANGFKPKTLTTRMGTFKVDVPQVRQAGENGERFYPNALERGTRSERALKAAIAEMYIQGVSTRRVKAITEELCGTEVSSSQVSRATALLDEELAAWRQRPIEPCPYLVLDARYEKVRIGGVVVSAAVLVAMGVRQDGKRVLLGISVATSEAEVHWRAFIDSLILRGLRGVQLVTSDDHAGIKAALRASFPGVAWQRCQFHLQRNAQAYVSKLDLRSSVADDIRAIFNAPDLAHAEALVRVTVERYAKSEPKLAAWLDENIREGLAVFSVCSDHRRRLRTSNSVERVNRELKRRTRVASLFPNTESLLRLATALAVEISDDWESGRTYLTFKTN